MLRRLPLAALLLVLAVAMPAVNVQWCVCDEGPADCTHVQLAILIDAFHTPLQQRAQCIVVAQPRASTSPFFDDIFHIPLLG